MRILSQGALWLAAIALAGIPARATTIGGMFLNSPAGMRDLVLTTGTGTVTVNAISLGWWDASGAHNSANPNYAVGDANIVLDHHNYFVFDLTNINSTILSAYLSISNGPTGFMAGNPAWTAIYSVWDVSTPIPLLTADGVGQTGIYSDLGSGSLFASRAVDATDNGTQVLVNLNATALVELNNSVGGQVAMGGALTTVPEPAAVFLFGSALAALTVARRKRRNL